MRVAVTSCVVALPVEVVVPEGTFMVYTNVPAANAGTSVPPVAANADSRLFELLCRLMTTLYARVSPLSATVLMVMVVVAGSTGSAEAVGEGTHDTTLAVAGVCRAALMVTLVTLFGTPRAYEYVPKANAGDKLLEEGVKEVNQALSLCTRTVMVYTKKLTPSCAVTLTSTVLSPVTKDTAIPEPLVKTA